MVGVITEETLWEGRHIKALLIKYRDRSGRVHEWEAVGRLNCDGVVIVVPVTLEDELVLIRQYRPVLDGYVMELPAGLVGPGEDPREAGRRELLEETGHEARDIRLLADGAMSTGINTERWVVLLADGVREASPEMLDSFCPDENEDIEVIKVPLAKAFEALQEISGGGDLVDLRIYGLVQIAIKALGRQ